MKLDLKVTSVFERNYQALIDKTLRFIINQGGSRSSKTVSLCQLMIVYCLSNPKKQVSIVRKTMPTLRGTIMRDFFEVLKDLNLYSEKNHNKTESIYTFPNGSTVEFFGVDDSQKLRGRKRDILFANEANELSFEEFNQLNMRTTTKLFFDFNPSDLDSWIYPLISREESILIKSTYKDNPFLPEAQVKEIEELINVDENYYRVYALGLPAIPKSTIFTHQKMIDKFPENEEFDNWCYGIDFGYQHPTAIVKTGRIENRLYAKEILYESYLTSTDLIQRMQNLSIEKHIPLICDYARPEMIADLRRAGYNAINANKNVKEGIDNIKSMQLFISKDSINLLKELRNYRWKTKGETIIEEPVKFQDDACFVGETLITTKRGLVQIKDIISNEDYVLTSKGYKKVLNLFNNGVKNIFNYRMQFGTDIDINIKSTSNHLIKTTKEWEQISKLQSGMTVFLNKPSMGKYINYILEEDILCNTNTTCIKKCGSSIMEQEKKDTIFITLMEIHGIIKSQILKKLRLLNIYQNIQKKELKKILNGLKNFIKMELKLQKNGINLKKEKNGINNMQKTLILDISLLENLIVKYVQMYLKKILNHKDFAQINVNQNTEEILDLTILKECVKNALINLSQINIVKQKLVDVEQSDFGFEQVYDIEVEDVHEYFANGLLVHNCDSLRYSALYLKKNNSQGLAGSFMSFNF
jgi:phage terminase large subunit